jgi:hypothetical protein
MRNNGTMNDNLCARLCFIFVPTLFSTGVGGIAIAAIMDNSRKVAKKMTIVRRIFAMSLYLRKYLRSVSRAARCEDDERAQM